jgi:hypothetical protein
MARFEQNRGAYITPDNREVISAARAATKSGGTDKDQGMAAWSYIHSRVKYVLSREWKTPAQTLREGTGDCEDVTFLAASMLLNMSVSDPQVAVGTLIYPNGDNELHTWVKVDGLVVDPTGSPDRSPEVTYKPVKTYTIATQ